MPDVPFDTVPLTSSRTMRGVKGNHAVSNGPQGSTTPSTPTQTVPEPVPPGSIPKTPEARSLNMRSEAAKHARDLFTKKKQPQVAYEQARAAQVAAQAAAAPQQQANDEQAEAASAAPASKPDPTDTRYERARRAFLKAGILDVVEAGKPQRDQFIRRGLNLAEKQRSADRERNETQTNQKAASAAEPAGQGSRASTSTGTPSRVPPVSVDFDALTAGFADEGEEFREKVKAALKGAISPVLDELAQLRAQRAENGQAAGADGMTAAFKDARAKLTETFPDLADDDDFGRVIRWADKHDLANDPDVSYEGATPEEQAMGILAASARAIGLRSKGAGERAESDDEQQGAASAGFMDVTGGGTTAPQRRAPSNEAVSAYNDARNMFLELGTPRRDRILAALLKRP